jgi:hypothetical protein
MKSIGEAHEWRIPLGSIFKSQEGAGHVAHKCTALIPVKQKNKKRFLPWQNIPGLGSRYFR